jgi:hypothetical protein
MVTALLLTAALPLLGERVMAPPILELRVKTYGSLDAANLTVARQMAETVLASGGLHVVWRICGDGECTERPTGERFVVVRLLPMRSAIDPTRAGEVVRNRDTAAAQVLVYLGRNAAVAAQMRQGALGRSSVALSTLLTGHLVGLTIAHEVGHILGLAHTELGPMKAQLDPADVVAARTSAFEFSDTARETMCQALGGGR